MLVNRGSLCGSALALNDEIPERSNCPQVVGPPANFFLRLLRPETQEQAQVAHCRLEPAAVLLAPCERFSQRVDPQNEFVLLEKLLLHEGDCRCSLPVLWDIKFAITNAFDRMDHRHVGLTAANCVSWAFTGSKC